MTEQGYVRTLSRTLRVSIASSPIVIAIIYRLYSLCDTAGHYYGIDLLFHPYFHPFYMLVVLSVPCFTTYFQIPIAFKINMQRRYTVFVLNLSAVVIWLMIFGPVFSESWAEWDSRYLWVLVFIPPALSWYLLLGWVQDISK